MSPQNWEMEELETDTQAGGQPWEFVEVVFVPVCSVTRKQGYQEMQGQRRGDLKAGGEQGRYDPSSKRGEGDWTTGMMDDTAASNTHLSSRIINPKQDDQYSFENVSTAVFRW